MRKRVQFDGDILSQIVIDVSFKAATDTDGEADADNLLESSSDAPISHP